MHLCVQMPDRSHSKAGYDPEASANDMQYLARLVTTYLRRSKAASLN